METPQLITAISYWVLIVLWTIILFIYAKYLKHSKRSFVIIVPLLTILSIDALRTLFESVFFGLYFNSMFGVLPKGIHNFLSDPRLILVPKLLNIVAGVLVLVIMVKRWLPREIEDIEKRKQQEQLLIQQSKMAAMGEMLNAIAHQWKQPLNAIGIVVQDIEDAYENNELDRDYINDTIKTTMDQIQYMNYTINDFMDFVKPSKQKVAFKINRAVINAISLVYKMLGKSNIDIKFKCDYDCKNTEALPGSVLLETGMEGMLCEPELVSYGYPNEFKQVLINIINNARDAIKDRQSDGKLPLDEKGFIEIVLSTNNNKAILEIRDNGKGIAEDKIDSIFDMYYTDKPKGHGTGIGLYLARTIIETNMDGKIYARNSSTKSNSNGAVFTIELNLLNTK